MGLLSLGCVKLGPQLLLEVALLRFVVPVLLPEHLIGAARHLHVKVHVLAPDLELLEVVVVFKELVDLFFLLLLFKDGLGHLALGVWLLLSSSHNN
jgi:hypothetical protein